MTIKEKEKSHKIQASFLKSLNSTDMTLSCYESLTCVGHSALSDSLHLYGLQTARLLCPWNSTGKNTGVGSQPFFQRIFLAQGLNLGLLHCRQILYHLNHQGNLVSLMLTLNSLSYQTH